jgi:membrane protein implicated in regulation of membrane protease activity
MALLSRTDTRLFAAAVAIAAWMLLLFTGWAFGGLVHALLVVALFLVPWHAVPRSGTQVVEDAEQAVAERSRRETN